MKKSLIHPKDSLTLSALSYFDKKGNYKVKDGGFYTVFGEKKIDVISSKHIKFDGYDYYLEE